jgi:hypothetical protein
LLIAALLLVVPATAIIRSLTPPHGTGSVISRLGASVKKLHLAQTERVDRVVQSKPRLILQQSASGAVDDVIPLGAQVVDDETVGGTLEIQPLPVGMTISSGRPIGNLWRIRAADAINATINPPAGFSGAVDLTVELRLSDDTIVDFGSVHREWRQRPTAVTTVIEQVRGVAVSDITAKNVTATSTQTEETAQLQTNLPASHPIDGGASIETGGAEVVLKVQPGVDERHTAIATASAKPKRGAVRSRIHALAAPDSPYQVYDAGSRVGADPDPNIRMTLARQYAWLN